jgi:hypothetical protein
MMRIGIDLDNTIVDYDAAFSAAAGIAGGKAAVRAALRAQPGGEARWTALQAEVYGPSIEAAVPYAGVDVFLRACAVRSIPVWIVSHKTEVAAARPDVNLRAAARGWLERRGFLAAESPVRGVYFESTRDEKLARIAALACTHFIDDLEEVLREPAFPPGVRRVLFGQAGEPGPFAAYPDWASIRAAFFGHDGR